MAKDNLYELVEELIVDLVNEIQDKNNFHNISYYENCYFDKDGIEHNYYNFKYNNKKVYSLDSSTDGKHYYVKLLKEIAIKKANNDKLDFNKIKELTNVIDNFSDEVREELLLSLKEYKLTIKEQKKAYLDEIISIKRLVNQLLDNNKKKKYLNEIKNEDYIYLKLLSKEFNIIDNVINNLVKTHDELIEKDIKYINHNNAFKHKLNVFKLWIKNKTKG